MSLKTLLMPVISQHVLSRSRLEKMRETAERARVRGALAHQLHYFHQVDDPYSALTAQTLGELLQRYGVELQAHVVGPVPDAAAPERAKLVAYSRRDAQRLAQHYGLRFTDPGVQPSAFAVGRANEILVQAIQENRFFHVVQQVTAALWDSVPVDAPDVQAKNPSREVASQVRRHLLESEKQRAQWGHYLGATFYYGGEWYWGIDRLYHLEQRLQELGVQRPGVGAPLFVPPPDLLQPIAFERPPAIDFFFSLRSPYSAIVAQRVFDLGRLTGATVKLRYLLPMVMRGLPVPAAKRRYIAADAAREAYERGIPFGRLNDPVGKPTERGLALMPLAEREGKGQAYVLSFLRGVWAEGIDAGSDRGLRTIAERSGLSWEDANIALHDNAWRAHAEANRQDMFSMGLWGVPSFRVDDTAVWGQDRLWVVQNALLQAQKQEMALP